MEERQQSGQFEDQLRRMILTNHPAQTGNTGGNQQRQPPIAPAFATPNQTPGAATFTGSGQATYNGAPAFLSDPRGFQTQNFSGPNFGRGHHHHNDQPNSQYRGNFRGRGFHQAQNGFAHGPSPNGNHALYQRARFQQSMPLDPDAFQRGGPASPRTHQQRSQQLFNPNGPPRPAYSSPTYQHHRQAQYLERVAATEISNVEMGPSEHSEKEAFRLALQSICDEVCDANTENIRRVSLECFGSFKSGFATAGSDMDLVIVVKTPDPASDARFSLLEDDLPRSLEKRLLQLGYGARLLTRTRVPIIKICEKPNASLLDKLREEREKWDDLPNEKKYPHLHQAEDEDDAVDAKKSNDITVANSIAATDAVKIPTLAAEAEAIKAKPAAQKSFVNGDDAVPDSNHSKVSRIDVEQPATPNETQLKQRSDDAKAWTRERKAGPLDFPKSGVGIQSDINFFNPLGIHNTQLLRCYSVCDPRVRPMVLFIKAWTKRRKINSSYSGTLSSYGYVLMVLHYLVNIVQPPVLPNLQSSWRPTGYPSPTSSNSAWVDGCYVDFWYNENEISSAAQRGLLTANRESLGSLLVGFFHYYAYQGGSVSFAWMQQVLSLRSVGGILTKEEKGWTKAVTEEGEGKRIQHRYLFCIEDPFELNHNVARTVTHKGIVAIRDEFRRARRILQSVGNGYNPVEGELFSQLVEAEDFRKATEELKLSAALPNSTHSVVSNGSTKSVSEPKTPSSPNSHNAKQQVNSTAQRRGRGARQGSTGDGKRGNKKLNVPNVKAGALDVNDNEAFPILGAKSPKGKRGTQKSQAAEEYSEIAGDKAKKLLEEVKMKKLDAAMESTATNAAEAVLFGDSD